MAKRNIAWYGVVLLVVTLVWLSWPVYEFYTYRGKAPLLPFGWMTIPLEDSETQQLHEEAFEEAGNQSLQLLTRHWKSIGAPAISAAVAQCNKVIWAGASGLYGLNLPSRLIPKLKLVVAYI